MYRSIRCHGCRFSSLSFFGNSFGYPDGTFCFPSRSTCRLFGRSIVSEQHKIRKLDFSYSGSRWKDHQNETRRVSQVSGKSLQLGIIHNDSNRFQGIPLAAQVYVSAITANSVAVSGPPPTLQSLFSSEHAPGQKRIPIPVNGPYHAPHLHSTANIEQILRLDGSDDSLLLATSAPQYSVISPTSGAPYTETTTRSLLISVVHDILNEPLQFGRILDGCVSKAQNHQSSKCLVIPLGPTNAANTLATMLKTHTDHDVTLRQSPSLAGSAALGGIGNHGNSGRCKLAIVGMAGRFPDAASHEKLWELLEKGLDVHREVSRIKFVIFRIQKEVLQFLGSKRSLQRGNPCWPNGQDTKY